MDEATSHLHVDFIPVATEQSRGLSTRVSMQQALKESGTQLLEPYLSFILYAPQEYLSRACLLYTSRCV